VCVCVCVLVDISVCAFACLCVCLNASLCVCVCVYVCAFVSVGKRGGYALRYFVCFENSILASVRNDLVLKDDLEMCLKKMFVYCLP
jgi:hypothetical protein